MIDRAKADGSWSQGDAVHALIVPPDLEAALAAKPEALAAYEALPDSQKKQYLWQVYNAKRSDTRARRIDQVVERLME